MSELEPKDSRNVTGMANTPDGRWTKQQNAGQPSAQQQAQQGQSGQMAGDQMPGQQMQSQSGQMGNQGGGRGQQSQFDSGSGGQQFGGSGGALRDRIREHMEVIGADGVHLGTVDKIEGDRIKLIKADSGMGSHQGHHHYLPLGLVAEIEGDKVRLSANADVAYGMEDEQGD